MTRWKERTCVINSLPSTYARRHLAKDQVARLTSDYAGARCDLMSGAMPTSTFERIINP